MGTEVLLPSKALQLLLLQRSCSASTSSLPSSQTVLRRKTRIWPSAKITSEWLHRPCGQRRGRGQPQSRCCCSCWWGFQETQYRVSAPAWGDKDLPGLPFRLLSRHPMAPLKILAGSQSILRTGCLPLSVWCPGASVPLGLSSQLPLPIQMAQNTGFSYCSHLQGRKTQWKDGWEWRQKPYSKVTALGEKSGPQVVLSCGGDLTIGKGI